MVLLKRLGVRHDRTARFIAASSGIRHLSELAILGEDGVKRLIKDVQYRKGEFQFGALQQAYLLLVYHWVVYCLNISKIPIPAECTVSALRAIKSHQTEEAKLEPPEVTTALTQGRDWFAIFEAIELDISRRRGCTGRPWTYLTRLNEEPAPEPPTGWKTMQQAITMRAPYYEFPPPEDGEPQRSTEYEADNRAFYRYLQTIFTGHPSGCSSYIKMHEDNEDGRKAWKDIFNQFLGVTLTGNLATETMDTLRSLSYHKETRNWDFAKYTSRMIHCFTVLSRLKTKKLHSGIDPFSQVQYLMDGIHNESLESVKNTINASPAMLGDFRACVDLFSATIGRKKKPVTPGHRSLNVSSATTGGSDNRRPSDIPWDECKDANVEIRFYKPQEYKPLSLMQKAKLWHSRRNRQSKSKRSNAKSTGKRKRNNQDRRNISNADVKKITDALVKATIARSSSDSDSEDSSAEPSNRNHPGLDPNKRSSKRKK